MPKNQIQSQDISAPRTIPPIVTYPDLKAIFGIKFSRLTIRRRERDNGFPKHIKISKTGIAWRSKDIQAWIDGLSSYSSPGSKQPTVFTMPLSSLKTKHSSVEMRT